MSRKQGKPPGAAEHGKSPGTAEQGKPPGTEDEYFRSALGKIDKLKLMEPLYHKALHENETLRRKLQSYETTDIGDEPSVKMLLSASVTQNLLNAADVKKPDHPTEFFEVMKREKQEEINILTEKLQNSNRALEKCQLQLDELQRQIENLKLKMAEKDRSMKQLEHSSTLTDEEMFNSRQREEIAREFRLTEDPSPSMSWENQEPRLSIAVGGEEEPETVTLRRRIDDLKQRVTELLNHNEKWNALCKELQEQLDEVKGQLQYQKAEPSDQETLMANLKDQVEKKVKAEQNSLLAKEQVAKLERRVSHLERQLVEKERQERETIDVKVKEEVRQKTIGYEAQLKTFQTDFENERRDHVITKNQLDSQRKQWQNIFDELQRKTQQLIDISKQLEAREMENNRLKEELKEACSDQLLIRHHAIKFSLPTPLSSKQEPEKREWTCSKCTYINTTNLVTCEICENSRENEEPLGAVGGLSIARGQLEEDGCCVKQSQWWACNMCRYRNIDANTSCRMCAIQKRKSHD